MCTKRVCVCVVVFTLGSSGGELLEISESKVSLWLSLVSHSCSCYQSLPETLVTLAHTYISRVWTAGVCTTRARVCVRVCVFVFSFGSSGCKLL